MPSGDDVNVRWDDGSNFTVASRPGRTAFIDCVALYNALTPKQKSWVDNSLVEYPASPCEQAFCHLYRVASTSLKQPLISFPIFSLDEWMTGAKAMGNGLAMLSEGKEKSFTDADPAFAQKIPLVCFAQPGEFLAPLMLHLIFRGRQVWLNPVTGEKALQVHAIIAYKIHYKESVDGPVTILDDLVTVRQMLDEYALLRLFPVAKRKTDQSYFRQHPAALL